GFSVDHGLAAQLPERSADLREVPDEGETGRQDRHHVSERRFRQRLPQGPEGRTWRQGIDDHRRGKLRDLRADDRQPHRQAEGHKLDGSVVYGYGAAQTMVKVLQMCGDNLTRENVMKQAASLKDFAPDTLLPGIKITTTATDFAPIEQLQMMRFKGEKWDLFGDIISGELSN